MLLCLKLCCEGPFGEVSRDHRYIRAQRTGKKGDIKADWWLANWAGWSSGLHFFVLFSLLFPCFQVVCMLCPKLQIPET
ncbi:hypothetical protein H5410_051107 [Solanum commersonii]|uniref:Uncharacterized protein n=1 Tax=Solanum commersonii TaxID=4109 RepID=A0A9J5WZZ0_SOLCO|nr:hypothetical protein H5410_051107 [Solanum commersonii]